MKSLHVTLLGSALIMLLSSSAWATTTITFNNGGADSSWSDTANWNPTGLPSITTDVHIGTLPSNGGLLQVDTSSAVNDIASLTYDNTFVGSSTIETESGQALELNGALTNNNGSEQFLSISVFAAANAIYNGGTAGVAFNDLTLATDVTLTNPVPAIIHTAGTLTIDGNLVFQLNSNSPTVLSTTSGYSQVIQNSGTFDASAGTIFLSGTYAGNAGDVFQLVTTAAGGTVELPTSVNTTNLISLSANVTPVSTLILKGIEFFEPSAAAGGGNLINAGTVLPIGNDSEFNPLPVVNPAAFNVTFNGGELLTANNGALDTGGTPGTPYSTTNLIGINTTGGTIASVTGNTATYGGVIANGNGTTGVLTIGDATNTGTVIFNAANSFTGTYAVADGTLQLGGSTVAASTMAVGTAGTLSGAGTVGGNATLTGGGIINFTNPGNIAGTLGVTGGNWNGAGSVTGAVTSSSGTFTIGSGANLTDTGGLNVTGGTLAGSGTVNGNATLSGGAIINFTNPGNIVGTLTVTGGNWNGAGSVGGAVTSNSGILTIGSGANLTATSGVTIAGGTLAAGNSASTITGSVNYTSGSNSTFAGVIAGAGSTLTVNNASANLTLSGTNTYGGATTIMAGTLTLNGGSTAAGSTVTVDSGATLAGTGTVNGSTDVVGGTVNMTGGHIGGQLIANNGTINGTVTVTGLTASNSGTFTIGSGANLTANGGVDIAGGTLAAGSATSTITGSVSYNDVSASTYQGIIAGTGSTFTLNNGAAVVTLSGANTYTGVTTITAGKLIVIGSTAAGSAVTVGSAGILAGTGTVNGSLTVSPSGIIAPGTTAGTAGTLHVGSLGLSIGNGSVLDIDLATATTVGGGVNDLIALGGGTLTLGGTTVINLNTLGTLTSGTAYTLINGAGSVSGFNASNFTLNGLPNNLTATFSDTTSTLLVTFSAAPVNGYYYTGATSTVFTDPSNYNTTATSGVAQTNPLGSTTDVFIGTTTPTPSNITPAVTSNVTINSLTFTPSGSGGLISGGSTLTINNGVTVQTAVPGTETISAFLALGGNQTWTVTDAASTLDIGSGGITSGAFSLTKSGAGTLILGAPDGYTGATIVNGGTLKITNNASLGGTSSVTVANGATLLLSGGITTSTAVPTTLNGTGIAGNGALESTANNTYTGLLTLGSAATIGSDTGTLTLSNVGTITGSGFGLTLTGATNGALASIIGTGAGTLTKAGAGKWTLSGANTFTGATTINAGTLAVGAGGSLASSSGVNLAASGVTFDVTGVTGATTVKDLTGVAGSFIELGANDLTFGTANPTTIASTIEDGGNVGSITKIGSGTVTLSGANTYSGGTTINGGEIKVASVNTNLGSGPLALGGGELLTTTTSTAGITATLNAGANVIAAATATTATYSGAIGGTGSVTLGDASNTGTIVFAADNNYGGTTTIAANTTLQVGANGTTGSVGTGNVTDNGVFAINHTNNITVTNVINGTGSLVQSGTGTTTLTASNGYTGGTTITNGAVSVASVDINLGTGNLTLGGGELITTTTAVATNKTVTLNAGTDTIAAQTGTTAVYNGVIGGTGALTVGDGTNAGLVVLGATNTYGGGTTIANGTLKIGTGSTTGSVTGNILDNAALVFNHSGNFTYAGVISGTGTVTNSQGTLILTGANTYGGATTLTAGTLQLSGTGSIANSALTVGAGTTLAAIGTTNGVGALTVNTGTVTLQNAATNTLNGTTLTVAAGGGTLSIDVGATAGASDLVNLSGAATFNGTPLTINIASLGSSAIGTHYTFMTAAGGGLLASDFTLGALTGTLGGMGDTVTFGISGNSAFLQINGAPVNTYFYTGATSTDFTDMTNYNTTASGGVVQPTALSATSNVTIGTTSPIPTNITPVLGSNLTINTLAFAPSGSGATLSGAGTLTVMNGVTVLTGVAGTETISAPVALGASQSWTVTDAGSKLVDSGGISGAGFGLTKGGLGTLVFSGANTYTGATTVSSGALNLQSSGALNGTSGVTVASGAALQLQGGITTAAAPLTLSGTGVGGNGALENISGANNYAGLVTLAAATTIGSDAGTLNLTNVGTITGNGLGLTLTGAGNGSISSIIGTGAGGLTKSGAGTWTLNGVNTFAGATTINAGTLALGATGSLASSSAVSVAAAGTLSGAGTVGGTTTVSGGTVNGTGLTLTGLVTFNGAGSTLSGTETAVAGVAITGAGTVAQSGTLTGSVNDTSSGASTFAGVIAGVSTVTENGSGSLTLSGANTYTGGTTLSSGTLDVTGAGKLGVGSPLTVGGGTLDLGATSQTVGTVGITGASTIQNGTLTGTSYSFTSPSGTSTVSAVLAGPGALTASGAGTLALSGANSFSGGTTISAGTLLVGNTNAFGTGVVGVTQNGGTVTTAGVGGLTINVPGAYNQSGGTLTLQMNATPDAVTHLNAANDLLLATGAVTIDGILGVKFNFVPVVGDTFELLEGSSVTGTGLTAPVISPAGFLVTTTLNPTDYSITVTRTQLALAGALGAGATPNQAAILNAVDTFATSGPLFNALSAALAGATPAGVAQVGIDFANDFNPAKFANFARSTAFNNESFNTQQFDSYFETQRSEDGNFIVGNGQIDSSNLVVAGANMDPGLAMVSSRMLAWSPAPLSHGLLSDSGNPVLGGVDMKEVKLTAAQPQEGYDFNTFVMGNVVLGQNFSDNESNIAHADTTSGQVTIGADYKITPHLRAGALFGYSHTDATLDTNGSTATIDTYSPGVYASYADEGWYANFRGTYGFNAYTEDRRVSIGGASAFAHGAPDGDQIVINTDGGYDFHKDNWTFGPLLGLQYVHLDVNSFAEDGAELLGANEQVGKQETDSLRSRLGGHVSYTFKTGTVILTPHFDASWQHDFMDRSQGINAEILNGTGVVPFTVTTPDASRDSALLDLGLNADLNRQVTLFGDYAVQAGQSNYFGQSVQAGVKIGF